MGNIHVLDKAVSELIAAGEVIERPASIVKELLENAIDAKSTAITVEIKSGGIRFIRITDNGGGIDGEDVPLAFLRHATSKVSDQSDLDKIGTLGFRGEALASISAVSRVELISKTPEAPFGTRILVEGGETVGLTEAGCPDGTTIIVRDLFYNVPARLKFLKKDFSEGNAIQGIVEKIAMSHPEISFKLIKENKSVLHTAGDNQLISAIHSVLGKEFAKSLLPVSYEYCGIRVEGFVSNPDASRNNRAMQHFFVNSRYVKSRTCMVALEDAYKNAIMVSKFPGCVLKLSIGFDLVDVNVHPAKIEVRFVNEKNVFESIYFAVKTALSNHDLLKAQELSAKHAVASRVSGFRQPSGTQLSVAGTAPIQAKSVPASADLEKQDKTLGQEHMSAAQFRALEENKQIKVVTVPVLPDAMQKLTLASPKPVFNHRKTTDEMRQETPESQIPKTENHTFQFLSQSSFEQSEPEQPVDQPQAVYQEDNEPILIRMIGELFKTYILYETNDTFVLLDKHAAHERILFEQLKQSLHLCESQLLLAPLELVLSSEERSVVEGQGHLFKQYGFRFQMTDGHVQILEAPLILHRYDLPEIVQDMVKNIVTCKTDITPVSFEELLHSMACRSAIKAHENHTPEELEELVRQVYADKRIRHCPHGRPVGVVLTKYEIEKKFGRQA